jgi:hypothetical protein
LWMQGRGIERATIGLAALIQHSGGRPGIWRAGAMST